MAIEPLSFFLDTFIKLADTIINLEKAKLQDKQTIFNEVVKPLFEELEPVVLNYMDFFRKAKETVINTDQKDLAGIVQGLKKERDEMVMARVKVRALAAEISENIEDEQIVLFAQSVSIFFSEVTFITHVREVVTFRQFPSSNLSRLVDLLNITVSHNIPKERIIVYIDTILLKAENSWSQIVKSYQTLKIYSVSSPKLVKKNPIKKTK